MEFNVQTIRAAIGRDRGSHRARLEAGALRERYERLTL
jgi:hypothetical protein